MNRRHEEFMKRLLATFMLEAQEHVDAISACLLELEKAPDAQRAVELIETAFREAHSLKGAARAVNLTAIEAVCQSVETAFAELKARRRTLSVELLDTLHAAVDAIGVFVRSDGEARAGGEHRMAEAVRMLEGRHEGTALPAVAAPHGEDAATVQPEPRPKVDTVRIATAKLERLLVGTEDLVAAKLAAAQRVAEAREAAAVLEEWPRRWAGVRRDAQDGTLQSSRVTDFLEWNAVLVESFYRRLQLSARSLDRDRETLVQMVDRLLDDVKTTLMQPIATLLNVLPKVARDLARDRGKDVEVAVRGPDLEVDRRILEEMKDPLVHVIRNCIDHGIERPADRREKGKPARGTITIAVAAQEANRVELLIEDDGAGVDMVKLKTAAVKLGILPAAEADALDLPAALTLAFRSGVTTSSLITDISGRGLGLAIVRDKVERLGGTVALTTAPGAGTAMRIVLPTVLATFRGLIVRISDYLFVLPLATVRRAIRVHPEMIKTVENREAIALGGRAVALAWLGDVLGIPRMASPPAETTRQAVVTGTEDRSIAFVVDEVLGEQEVVAKPLGPHLTPARYFTGAAALGTGRVALILHAQHLLEAAASAPAAAVEAPPLPAPRPQSILVVEDSITARALIRGILEAAGYAVETAVDGAEALATLRTGAFDLVVSDVDMPRMNGFDLTARIRADQRLADLPVVLVTALESREDRERGVDVGANAYIVKSSFDQSNLLEVIARLI